jgi:hypothetical protein
VPAQVQVRQVQPAQVRHDGRRGRRELGVPAGLVDAHLETGVDTSAHDVLLSTDADISMMTDRSAGVNH